MPLNKKQTFISKNRFYKTLGMINSIVFDWGGVLIDRPTIGLLHYFAGYFNITGEKFINTHKKYEDSFQKGTLPEDSYWEKMCADLSVNKPVERSLWKKAFKSVYHEKKDVFNLVIALKKNGYKTGFLSNTETPAMEFFHEQKYSMFDVLIFSCKEGFRKPGKEIYEITLDRLNTRPDETIFIDDRIENIRGAESLGIRTILFINNKDLREKLTSFSIKI